MPQFQFWNVISLVWFLIQKLSLQMITINKLIELQMSLVVKNMPANAVDLRNAGSILGLGRSPGGGHGNLLQYSCLENPMDRGVWQAVVLRVTESTQLKQLSTTRQPIMTKLKQSIYNSVIVLNLMLKSRHFNCRVSLYFSDRIY